MYIVTAMTKRNPSYSSSTDRWWCFINTNNNNTCTAKQINFFYAQRPATNI